MQKNIFKALGIFTLALAVMSMAGAASAPSSHGHNNMYGYNMHGFDSIHVHNSMLGHNHNWNSFNDSNGQSGNSGPSNIDNGSSNNNDNSGSSNNDNSGSSNSGDGGSTASTPSAGFVTVNPHEGNTYWVGEDGHLISLINNNSAVNPTYSQLLAFIKEDKTDEQKYIPGKYTCGDFAETVHNNAEKAGYKAGWVTIKGINHCCNAFQTSDNGVVYIDCTGSPNGGGSWDSSVKLANGMDYLRIPLFTKNFYFNSMGIVSSFKAYW